MNLGILPLEERIVMDAAGAVDLGGAAFAPLPGEAPQGKQADEDAGPDETAERARRSTSVLAAQTIDGSGLPDAAASFADPWTATDTEADSRPAAPADDVRTAAPTAARDPFGDARLSAVQDGISALLDDDGRISLMAAQSPSHDDETTTDPA